LSPAEYRQRYGLKPDYPMISETYSAHRRELAKRIGLGRRPKVAGEAPNGKAAAKTPAAKRPRGRAAAAPAGNDTTK